MGLGDASVSKVFPLHDQEPTTEPNNYTSVMRNNILALWKQRQPIDNLYFVQ